MGNKIIISKEKPDISKYITLQFLQNKIFKMDSELTELKENFLKLKKEKICSELHNQILVNKLKSKLCLLTNRKFNIKKFNNNNLYEFICPITFEIIKDPVVATDGYSYERKSIQKWFETNDTSPLTNMIIDKTLVTNRNLKNILQNNPNLQIEWSEHFKNIYS